MTNNEFDEIVPNQNDFLILIQGRSSTGKSASLRTIRNQERVAYLNCESGKRLPFSKCKFHQEVITDPLAVPAYIDALYQHPDIDIIIIDSLSFLMEMFESVYVLPVADSRKAWGDYAQFFKNMMQQSVARSDKTIIFTSHVGDYHSEAELLSEIRAPVKGSLAKIGIEAFFSIIVATKRMRVKDLLPHAENNPLLTITPEDEALGFKYVYQVKLTKDTFMEKIRGPIDFWEPHETFINADIQAVLDRLKEFYS